MITAGTIAWASAAPGFRPPSPHPLLVLKTFPNGNCAIGFITHSRDLLRASVSLHRNELPSAFRERGGPLIDERSVVALIDDRGQKRVAIATVSASDRLMIGSSLVQLTHIVRLPDPEWSPLRLKIITALGENR